MSLGILTNVAATYAENNLNQTQSSLQTVLQQLSSGSRINSGADDAAGLSVADGLAANEAALTQSAQNAQNGVGLLQTADGASVAGDESAEPRDYAGHGGLERRFDDSAVGCCRYGVPEHRDGDRQHRHVDELQQHCGVFGHSDELCRQRRNDERNDDVRRYGGSLDLCERRYGERRRSWTELAADVLTSQAAAKTALADITTAVADVANQRGSIGANINQLNAAANVASSEEVNLSAAQSSIPSTNYGQATSDLAKYQVLSQTGISALAQANSVQQEILKLLQ